MPQFFDGGVHPREVDGVDLETCADAVWEGDAELAAEVFLELTQTVVDATFAGGVAKVVGIGPKWEAALAQTIVDGVEFLMG
ncbi:MAG: hypothetical protein RIS92_2671 [Verrucomicrobiota bacterium]